jgi:NADH/NAD ratio-sensing transcriptional regulator Rex
MTILFVYRYTWAGEARAYYVTHVDGVTTVQKFDGATNEVGSVVSSVPAERMAAIDAHIASTIEGLSSFASMTGEPS